jgi:hypothetical protein
MKGIRQLYREGSMQFYSNAQSRRWIYIFVLAMLVLSGVFGGSPRAAFAQSETPPPPAPMPGQGGGEMTAQCSPPDEPPTPTLISPANGSTIIITVPKLSWTASPSKYCVDYYNVQVWVDGGAMVLSQWPKTASFTLTTPQLTFGVKYNWYVWAHNIVKGFSDPMIGSFSTTTVTNDDFNYATVIPVAPNYSISESTLLATTSSDDPAIPAACAGLGQGHKSVWWKFTPNSPGSLQASTAGSNYDTLLDIWTGTRGALVNAACTSVANTALVNPLQVKPGTTYYIEVIQPGALDTGGTLNLSVTFVTAAVAVPFVSVGAYDGWLLETTDGSSKAGSSNTTDSILIVGNTPNGRRYRSFLSFNTALPSKAVIISAVITLKMSSISNPTPYDFYTGLLVDIRKPYFGSSVKLQLADYDAASSLKSAGTISEPATPNSPYVASLLPTAFPFINRAGTTQFRLRFPGDDIDNDLYDTIKFYSGDATTVSFRPTLVVTYYIP